MPVATPSLRSLRSNIWRGLCCATDQEIHDGISFYPGAHGLCHLLSLALSSPSRTITPSQIAGMYAALSPMNNWESNVANIMDLIRDPAASVNTTHINRDKALHILHGASPLSVLGGRKVSAFFRAIDDPTDTSPIPVDRHLINLALGIAPDKQTQSQLASDRELYSRIEGVYRDLGAREGMGNRLSSISWFVQRRISRTGQSPLLHPSLVCASCSSPSPLLSHGTGKGRRLRCSQCGRTRAFYPPTPAKGKKGIDSILYDFDLPITPSQLAIYSSRPLIYLGKTHPYATGGGRNWLARYVVMYRTQEKLRKDEHVHHRNGEKLDCRSTNLKVLLAMDHGRLHARKQLLYMLRDRLGRWCASEVPGFENQDHYQDQDQD